MSLWEAPKRVVVVDGGVRAKALAFWLKDEHNIDMSKIELRQSPLEGLGVFAAQVFWHRVVFSHVVGLF